MTDTQGEGRQIVLYAERHERGSYDLRASQAEASPTVLEALVEAVDVAPRSSTNQPRSRNAASVAYRSRTSTVDPASNVVYRALLADANTRVSGEDSKAA